MLDEPLAGLISSVAERLGKLISEIYGELGIGVVIVEHKLSHLSSIARGIVAMNAGKVVFDTPVEEAMSMVRKLLLGRHGGLRMYPPNLLPACPRYTDNKIPPYGRENRYG